ncbi:hypothetical protein B296_00008328 [Ensete ventricosum]|uniref:Uncharacterized protein n=1 Tax=Ensete ventricosum TaxID=4639 RepID=A0A426YNA4_ENSVE|nr:hypothetical protein B296_00008328 [Ensete ventricosum]
MVSESRSSTIFTITVYYHRHHPHYLFSSRFCLVIPCCFGCLSSVVRSVQPQSRDHLSVIAESGAVLCTFVPSLHFSAHLSPATLNRATSASLPSHYLPHLPPLVAASFPASLQPPSSMATTSVCSRSKSLDIPVTRRWSLPPSLPSRFFTATKPSSTIASISSAFSSLCHSRLYRTCSCRRPALFSSLVVAAVADPLYRCPLPPLLPAPSL